MGKRGKPEKELGAPLWMCTFGDLMSLLLCFFIMLFAISIIAEIKWEALVETLERRMGYSGHSRRESDGRQPAAALSSTPEESRRNAAMTGSQPTAGPGGEFGPLRSPRTEGPVVKGGLILFNLGSEELNEQAKKDLDTLYSTLASSRSKIMVRGHAAPSEIEEEMGIFRRDFYLAYQRAVNVKNYLIELGLKEEFFQISTSDSSSIPNRAVLPPGADPRLAGASAAVYLLGNTRR